MCVTHKIKRERFTPLFRVPQIERKMYLQTTMSQLIRAQHRYDFTHDVGGPSKVAKPMGKKSLKSIPVELTQQNNPSVATPIMRHRLKKHLPFWKSFVVSSLVLGWIEFGYNLKWLKDAPAPITLANHKSCEKHTAFIDATIADLLAAQSIRRCETQPLVVCPLGVVEQREKPRMIYDARYLNQHCEIPKFKYEGLEASEHYVRKNDYMWTVDLSKGYHHIDMHPESTPYMGLQWKGQYYVWQSLPFGLAPACWVFTKVTRELLKKWRSTGHRCGGYIDDFNNCHECSEELTRIMNRMVLADLRACGFIVNMKKTMTEPRQWVRYLGMIINTVQGCINVPEDKKIIIMQLLHQTLSSREKCNYHLLEVLTGNLISLHWAFGPIARMMTMSIYECMKEKSYYIKLSEAAVQDIKFWITSFEIFDGYRPIWPNQGQQTVIYTDAAGNNAKSFGGWAGWSNTDGTMKIARGIWPDNTLTATSSAYIELTAIWNVIQSLNVDNELSGRRLLLKTDSQVVFHIIKKAGSHIGMLHSLFKSVWWYCFRYNIVMEATWIPRELNEYADWYSKAIFPCDIRLNRAVYNALYKIFGGFTIDLFASCDNYQLKPYFSLHWTPDTSGVDAFNFPWGDHAWCNPPFNQIGRVLNHVQRHGTRQMCLILPLWVQAPWWNKLILDGHSFLPYVHGCYVLPKDGLFSRDVKGERHQTTSMWNMVALLVDCSTQAAKLTRVPFTGPGSTVQLYGTRV